MNRAWQVFLESVRLFLTARGAEVGAAVFDKDDALAVEFVTAASNLRSAAYGIPTQTLFAAKVCSGSQQRTALRLDSCESSKYESCSSDMS